MTTTIPIFKITVIGDKGSGKTAFCQRFMGSEFFNSAKAKADEHRPQFFAKVVENSVGEKIEFSIWELSLTRSISSLTSAFYPFSAAILICVDLSNKASLAELNIWLENIDRARAAIYLIGTKADLTRQITDEALAQKAQALTCTGYAITSAETGEGIEEFFKNTLAPDLIERNKILTTLSKENSAAPEPKRHPVLTEMSEKLKENFLEKMLVKLKKRFGWVRKQMKNHPYGTIVGILLALGVIAVICIPVVGQIPITAALMTLVNACLTKLALTLGVSLLAIQIPAVTILFFAALTTPLWLGKLLHYTGVLIKKMGEILALPSLLWMEEINLFFAKRHTPILKNILVYIPGMTLLIVSVSPLVYLLGRIIEETGRHLAGEPENFTGRVYKKHKSDSHHELEFFEKGFSNAVVAIYEVLAKLKNRLFSADKQNNINENKVTEFSAAMARLTRGGSTTSETKEEHDLSSYSSVTTEDNPKDPLPKDTEDFSSKNTEAKPPIPTPGGTTSE